MRKGELKMAKRYYKVNEIIWIKKEGKKGKVVTLDIENLSAQVIYKKENGQNVVETFKFMEIDKVKAKNENSKTSQKQDTLLVAKVRDNAKVPSKREEDAGYDFYASLEPTQTDEGVVYEMYLKKNQANLVPTGIATSLLPKYYLNLKHERGSTGMQAMSILSGVIDSGYRDEIFVNIVPLHKDILITSKTDKVEDLGEVILYPYGKAIAQGTVDLVPQLRVKEISFEQLQAIPSERGTGKLGDSGK